MVITEAIENSHMLCCPRNEWRRQISQNYYCVVPILTVLWTIATIFMIIILQICQQIDCYFPFLGDYRRYTAITYAMLSWISMEKTNITISLLCSSFTHSMVDICNYIYVHYFPDISKNGSWHAITWWLQQLLGINICSAITEINGEDKYHIINTV